MYYTAEAKLVKNQGKRRKPNKIQISTEINATGNDMLSYPANNMTSKLHIGDLLTDTLLEVLLPCPVIKDLTTIYNPQDLNTG